jgi:hypothetical protein
MSASLITRLAALEAEVKALRTKTPLEAYTEGLKDATPEAIKDWMRLCNEVASQYLDEAAPKGEAAPKVKRATTNASGPAEWNVFLRATWHEMAAEAGVVIEEYDEADASAKESAEKAFKKAAAAAGVSYQSAMKEASRRKAELEGSKPKVKKVKETPSSDLAALKAKVAAAKAAKAAAPASPKASEAKAASPKAAPLPFTAVTRVMTDEESQRAAAAEMGWEEKVIGGNTLYYDPADGNCYSYPDGDNQVGVFYPAEEKFVPSE